MYKIYPKKYMTNQGETWDSISLDFYGNPYHIKELIDCNPKYSDVVVFETNVELSIPILENEKVSSLALWKQ